MELHQELKKWLFEVLKKSLFPPKEIHVISCLENSVTILLDFQDVEKIDNLFLMTSKPFNWNFQVFTTKFLRDKSAVVSILMAKTTNIKPS